MASLYDLVPAETMTRSPRSLWAWISASKSSVCSCRGRLHLLGLGDVERHPMAPTSFAVAVA